MRVTDPLIGSQLGDYTVVDLLGQGGMARVYRGYDAKLDRYAAVKVIEADTGSDTAAEHRQRFLREARAIARLHHPNVVGIYQFGQADAVYYMAMAFIEGRDLSQILKELTARRQLMPQRRVMQIARDIASALDHAHAGGVIHRDVKPSNIMVTADGRAILTDFGLALSVPEGTTGNTFGSAHYIAPEQALSSAQAVAQSDLYSLGVMLFQMLAGRVPFDDPSAMSVALKHVSEPPPLPHLLNPGITPELEGVILRALAKEPAQRYESGAAMIEALELALDLTPEPAPKQPAPEAAEGSTTLVLAPSGGVDTESDAKPPTPSVSSKRRRIIGAVALLAALVVAAAAVATSNSRPPVAVAADTPNGESAVAAAASTTAPTAAPTERPTAVPPTATPVPTGDAAEIAAAERTADSPVILLYDDRTLVLLNRSNSRVDASDLQFMQSVPNGNALTFSSNLWGDAEALRPGNCLQVWTNRYAHVPLPDACREQQSWRAVSFVRLFWISDDPDMTFEVRRDGAALATCRVGDGECAVVLSDEQ